MLITRMQMAKRPPKSVSCTKLWVHIIRQGQGYLDDVLRKYALLSYKAEDHG